MNTKRRKVSHLKAYLFYMEGALESSVVSPATAGRPDSTRLDFSEAKPTVSIILGGGGKLHSLPETNDLP